MKENQSAPAGRRGCLTEIAITLLAALVMLVISSSYRNFSDETFCRGGLGAGFPASFLCDYGTGGSPISSWGKIDLADFPYFSTLGLLTDILFYSMVIAVAWLIRRAFRQEDSYRIGNAVWVALIGIAFLAGFLSAAAVYKSERVNFQDYIFGIPSPVPATPTPFGTPPPDMFTPIPTAGP